MKDFARIMLLIAFLASSCDDTTSEGRFPVKVKATITSLSHLYVAEGDVVTFTGTYLTDKIRILVDGVEVTPTKVSDTEIIFTMPALVAGDVHDILAQVESGVIGKFAALDKRKSKGGYSNLTSENLCTDSVIVQADGSLLRGTRVCESIKADCQGGSGVGCIANADFPAVNKALIAETVAEGKSLLSIAGSAPVKPADCSTDGETSCVASVAFPSFDPTRVLADNLELGTVVAGVSGNLITSAPICSADDETACLTTSGFVAVHKVNTIQANLTKMKSSLALLGLNGGIVDCNSDGQANCVVNAPTYAAAALSGATNKILLGQTLAGVSGSVAVRPVNCAGDAGTNCVTITNFPAVNAANLNANRSSYKSTLTIGGVAGSMIDCSADGANGCEVVGPSYAAALLAGAEAKIRNGQIVAGVTGAAPVRPDDCDVEGGTNCVTTANFPATIAATAPLKVITGQTLAGLLGQAAGARPGNCSSDGQPACVSVAAFPAMKVTGAAAKIAAGVNLGGVDGEAGVRPIDCAADGAVLCVTTSNFPAVDKSALTANLDKIHDSFALVGLTGSLGDCSSDAEVDCVAVSDFPAAGVAGSASKILLNQSVAGISGSAPLRPLDCSAEGGTSCVTVTNFPALDKDSLSAKANKLRSSFSLQSVSGSLSDCSADGTMNCVTVAGFLAADTTGAAAKILSGQTLAGIPGSAGIRPLDCASDGATNCVTVANYPSIGKSSIASNTGLYRPTLSLGGVQGTLADCTVDNQANCVAITANPSVIASNVTGSIIKSGVTIAGVTGVYPNSTYPMTVSDGYADLDSSTFNAKIKATANFGWFDRNGARHSAVGDADLTAANIKSPVSMFGEAGSWENGTLQAPALYTGSTSTTKINLDFEKTCCVATGVLIVRRLDLPVIWSPTNGTDYTAGTNLGSNQTVIYKSTGSSLIDASLTAGHIYHYAAWTYDSSNAYSSASTIRSEVPYDSSSIGSINVQGTRWMTKKSVSGVDAYPSVSGNVITMIPAATYQETTIFRLDRFLPNTDVDFDYRLDRGGADGFNFSFGKNISEYVTGTLSAVGYVGLAGTTGYAIKFLTYNTNRISLFDYSTSTDYGTTSVPIESSIGQWVHVKIRVTSNNVKVFMNNSTTASFDYTHGSNFTFSYPFIAFGAGSGGEYQKIDLRNIVISTL